DDFERAFGLKSNSGTGFHRRFLISVRGTSWHWHARLLVRNTEIALIFRRKECDKFWSRPGCERRNTG
ncbi:MAG: hypothetical protein DI607_07480, partial [Sphingomonas hengshuiensis]